jgi:hypothetical protein
MENRIKFLAIVFLTTAITAFTSCSDDDITLPTDTHEDAYVDVILKKTSMNGADKYVPVFMAGGNTINATGCTVTDPNNTTFNIEQTWAGPGNLNGKGTLSGTKPPMGTYTFQLKFADGYTKTMTDVLVDNDLSLPIPITVTRIATTAITPAKIKLDWTAVPNADLICVKLTELNIDGTKPLFKIGKLPENATTYTINIDGSTGWMRPTNDLVTGTNYYITVAAKKVEAGKPIDGASKDFDFSACSKVQITY